MKILKDCFPKNLQHIFKTIEKIDIANSLVKEYLPEELKSCCIVTNLRQNVLVLAVSDGVWASQLRYQLPELLRVLRKEPMFCGLIKIEIIMKRP